MEALHYIYDFRTIFWTLDILTEKPEKIEKKPLLDTIDLIDTTIKVFKVFLSSKGFVTFKQIELMIEVLKTSHFILRAKVFEKLEY